MKILSSVYISTFLLTLSLSASSGEYSETCSWIDSDKWGENLSCQAPNVVFGLCGSGGNTDCANGKVATQLYCCNEPTATAPINPTTQKTSQWGKRLTCDDGQVVVDFCGSGGNKDCEGGMTNSITCATQESMTLRGGGTWYSTTDWGKQLFCPNAMVVTGACGSGRNHDCPNNATNEIRCTTYIINN